MEHYQLHLGDCLEALRGMPDNSVDSIVTDPPYGLSDHKPADVVACMTAWLAGEPYLTNKRGFMGKTWDSWVPGPEVWRECLRVLKPGGHVLAFAGSRTHDLMSMAMRLAGFECRDTIMYLYGSGFPKSLDVSKAIDKAGGASPREQSEMLREKRLAAGMTRDQVAERIGCTPASVRDWEEGRARSVGAAVEFIVPSEGYREKLADLLGYSSDERRLIGAASDRRGDGTGYGLGHSGELRAGGNTEAARQWSGWGTSLKPAFEPVLMFRKPLIGTVAENVLVHGTGALNIHGCRVGSTVETWPASRSYQRQDPGSESKGTQATGDAPPGRWPANICHDGSEEVVAGFPADRPGATSNSRAKSGNAVYSEQNAMPKTAGRGDTGSAARFFYCAKASKRDRDEGLAHIKARHPAEKTGRKEGSVGLVGDADNRGQTANPYANGGAVARNHHPTVKPTDLMAYLCRLVTPPGGTVLDPFMGSGSTGKAAMREGFRFIGCEMSPEYLAIAEARIAHELARVTAAAAPELQPDMFAA